MKTFRVFTLFVCVVMLCNICIAQGDDKPDLIITDIWPEGYEIHFQVMNIGDHASISGFDISIKIDSNLIEYYHIDSSLKPGERITDFFLKAQFNCNNDESYLISVEADAKFDITETDESNNIRQEQWNCDIQPPEITEGPDVQVGQTSCLITWKTDDHSDSKVVYSNQAGMFDQEVVSTVMTEDHKIDLNNLMPGTTYQYKVVSADSSGNTVTSDIYYFLTQNNPDNEQPSIDLFRPMTGQLPMHFFSDAQDNQAIDRVEYELDGQVIWTDYDSPYEAILIPHFLRLEHELFFDASHNVRARAFDLAGNTVIADFNWSELPRCSEVNLQVSSSGPFYVTTPDPSIPGHSIRLNITAKQREQGIVETLPDPRHPSSAAQAGDNAWGAVQEVRIYWDDVLQDTLYPDDPDDDYYVYHHNTGTMDAPSLHVIKITALSSEGCLTNEELTVEVGRIDPRLFLTRDVTRIGNYFHVELTIENTGSLPVTTTQFTETVSGFHAILTNNPGNAGDMYYDHQTRQSIMEFNWNHYMTAGDTITLAYDAVPVMHESGDVYQFEDAKILFEDDYGRVYNLDRMSNVTNTDSGRRLDLEAIDAKKASDYLIVTNPFNLFGIYNYDDCQRLLSKMAELATLRNAVLAYFQGQVHLHTHFDSNDKISCGNLYSGLHDEIVIMDEENDYIRLWSGAYQHVLKLNDDHYKIPIEIELSSDDAMITGNLLPDNDGDVWDEVVIVKGSGSQAGSVFGYRFDAAINNFVETATDTIPFNASDGDKVVCCDAVVTTPNPRKEIVLCNGDDGWVSAYYGHGGVRYRHFETVYRAGDLVAAGRLRPDAGDELVIGDVSADMIYIYHPDSETFKLSFAHNLTSHDHLFVSPEGLVIADESADRLEVWQIFDAGAARLGGFDCRISREDIVFSGRVLDRDIPQYLFARGRRVDHFSDHDLELFSYSVFGGMGAPGNRYDLDSMLNPGGQWANQLADDWTTNGYLLLVGEIEIIPSFTYSIYLYGYGGRHRVEFTDNKYSNTVDDMKQPELSMGRIPGNSAGKLADKLQRCIDIARGDQLIETSSAYVVSGGPEDRFDDVRNDRADQLRSAGYTTVNEDDQIGDLLFFGRCIDRDLIFLTGHGNPHGWDDKTSWEIRDHFDPGSKAPLVFGQTCKTGRYFASPDTYPEHWMEFGASAYIGATENTYTTYSKRLGEGFLGRYGPGTPAGLAMKNAKRDRMGDNNSKGKYHSAVFHLFGDPKMEPVVPSDSALKMDSENMNVQYSINTQGLVLNGPVSVADVYIPQYDVKWSGGQSHISIAGGTYLAEMGRPEVPAWPVTISFPSGYQIQNVTMVKTGQAVEGLGLPVPIVELDIEDNPGQSDGDIATEPWPDRKLDWMVETTPDDEKILRIQVYPFKSWPATTHYSFFDQCTINIDYNQPTVEINKLRLDKPVYEIGESVKTDLYIYQQYNLPKPAIILAHARVIGRDVEYNQGLPIKRLASLEGLGSVSWAWNSQAALAGDYDLEVQLKSSIGTMLDSKSVSFALGVIEGEMTGLDVNPKCFNSNQAVQFTAHLKNTGQVNITGRMVVEVQDMDGVLIVTYDQDFSQLSPGKVYTFADTWNSTVSRGQCRFVAYALFDGKRSETLVWPQLSPYTDGDFDNDGIVAMKDFSKIADVWLGYNSDCDIAPLTGDCMVDLLDLNILIERWMIIE